MLGCRAGGAGDADEGFGRYRRFRIDAAQGLRGFHRNDMYSLVIPIGGKIGQGFENGIESHMCGGTQATQRLGGHTAVAGFRRRQINGN